MLQQIHDEKSWEETPLMKSEGLFLQSSAQKKLYEGLGQKTWLFQFGGISSLVTKVEAKRGTFLFLPYGPVLLDPKSQKEEFAQFFLDLKKLAIEENASCIRVSPFWDDSQHNRKVLTELAFRPAPLHMLAETLWILPLKSSEEEILKAMDKKHRNLIRRAEKEGVEIRIEKDEGALNRFLDLHYATVERHKFTPYPKKYFELQREYFAPKNELLIFEAWWNEKLLASAMIMFYGNTAAYHHGSSSSDPELRKIPASYLLQWEIIREALKRGLQQYNLWGIAPTENPKHPFFGITHFKTGFGGFRKDLIPAHDLALNSKYYLNFAVEKLRKWKRGF